METPPESAHFLATVKTTLRILGYTNRDLERPLQLGGNYMSRVFSRNMQLHFQHVADIARSLGLSPQELLSLAYPQMLEPPTGEAALRYWAVLEPYKSPAEAVGQAVPETPTPALVQAVEEVVAALLQRMDPLALAGEPRTEPPVQAEAAPVDGEPAAPEPESRPRRRRKKT